MSYLAIGTCVPLTSTAATSWMALMSSRGLPRTATKSASLPGSSVPVVSAIPHTSAASAVEVCGIADTTGTLEPGKDADFVAVRGNPLEDINAIHDVAAVFVKGTQVPMAK